MLYSGVVFFPCTFSPNKLRRSIKMAKHTFDKNRLLSTVEIPEFGVFVPIKIFQFFHIDLLKSIQNCCLVRTLKLKLFVL